MDEFVCIGLVSLPAEADADFAARLSRFWTQMLRQFPDSFAQVYAEATTTAHIGDCCTRAYLVEPGCVAWLLAELVRHGIGHLPINPDDTYTKYEAVAEEWMQIEH